MLAPFLRSPFDSAQDIAPAGGLRRPLVPDGVPTWTTRFTRTCQPARRQRDGVVTVYPVGSANPYVIRNGIDEPRDAAFDKSGNLYVANFGDNTVKVYAPGGDTIIRTISDGVLLPNALAFHNNLLLVGNGGQNVTGYLGSHLVLALPTGDLTPSALTVAGHSLYVAAFSSNNSEVVHYDFFTKGKTKITDGVRIPNGVAACTLTEVCVQNSRDVTVYESDKLIQTIREQSSPLSLAVDR